MAYRWCHLCASMGRDVRGGGGGVRRAPVAVGAGRADQKGGDQRVSRGTGGVPVPRTRTIPPFFGEVVPKTCVWRHLVL